MTPEQWEAIKNRDPARDGEFFYALKSSGVVCRPSCRARVCRPENIIIFDSLRQALDAGYRCCSKCRPEMENWSGSRAELVKKLEALIEENYTEKFSLDALAAQMHMDKNYILRVYREETGTTLLQRHNSVRSKHAEELLKRPELSISYIASSVGFKTAAHFSRIFKKTSGVSPMEFRKNYFSSFH